MGAFSPQSLTAKHCTHFPVTVSHRGFVPPQFLSAVHATQRPIARLQMGPGEDARAHALLSSSHKMQNPRDFSQSGAVDGHAGSVPEPSHAMTQ